MGVWHFPAVPNRPEIGPVWCGEFEIRHIGRETESEFRIQCHTSNVLYLVWYSDLKFLNADAAKMTGTSNPPPERRVEGLRPKGPTDAGL